jgi:hypothetical protein
VLNRVIACCPDTVGRDENLECWNALDLLAMESFLCSIMRRRNNSRQQQATPGHSFVSASAVVAMRYGQPRLDGGGGLGESISRIDSMGGSLSYNLG